MVLYRVFVTMKLLTRIESLNIKSKSLNYTLRGKQSKWKVCLIVHFHNSKVAPWFCNLQKEVYRKIFCGSVITAITAETKMKLCKVRRIFLFKVCRTILLGTFATLYSVRSKLVYSFSVITCSANCGWIFNFRLSAVCSLGWICLGELGWYFIVR